jgi:hypothetical protein
MLEGLAAIVLLVAIVFLVRAGLKADKAKTGTSGSGGRPFGDNDTKVK